jgi:hypothetical protein
MLLLLLLLQSNSSYMILNKAASSDAAFFCEDCSGTLEHLQPKASEKKRAEYLTLQPCLQKQCRFIHSFSTS